MNAAIILVFLFAVNVFSQSTSPQWRNYLNSETVHAIAEEGNVLWIATQAGLTKLNKTGYEKEFFNKGNSFLPTNTLFDIKVDNSGYKWTATLKGLVKFKENEWTLYDSANSGIPHNDVRTIAIDISGNIWVGTNGGGIGKYDGNTWEVFNTTNSDLPSDFINDLEFENTILWIGTNSGLVKKKEGTWTTYNSSNSGLTINNVITVKVDAFGNKWVGGKQSFYQNPEGGVFKFNGVSWQNYMPSKNSRSYNSVYSIEIDRQNNKWIAANYYDPPYGGGIFIIDSSNSFIQPLNVNLPFNWTNVIHIDRMDVKWIGTDYGFVKFDQAAEQVNISNSMLGQNHILKLSIDEENNKYFSSFGDIPLSGEIIPPGFFSILDNSNLTWKYFGYLNSPFLFGVNSISFSSSNNVYVSKYHGFSNDLLYRYDGSTFNSINVPQTQYNEIEYLWMDTDKLWAYFSGDRLFNYANNNWVELSGFPGYGINGMVKTGDIYWFASGNALIKYENNIWQSYTPANSGLPHNYVASVAADAQNNIWAGTTDGLAKFDGTDWTIYNSANSPLLSDKISSLVFDKNGKLYIGTDNGLYKKDGENWSYFNSFNSGLPNGFFSLHGYYINDNKINALAVDTANNIWIATNGGVGVYDEDGIPLPVELFSFSADVTYNEIHLNWITATETNNHGFEVGKYKGQSSKDKAKEEVWETVGFVEGSGTTTEKQFYSFVDNNVEPGKYLYRLKQIDFDGSYEYSNEIEVEIGLPDNFELYQNYPNPFNPTTKIRYSIPSLALRERVSEGRVRVSLKVYDVLGNEIATLVNEEKPPGNYEVEFNAKGLASGVYFYRLTAGSFIQTKKMILLR